MADAVEANGNSRLQMENGWLSARDGAQWSRSKVTPPDKGPSGRVTALVDLESLHLGLGVRNDLWVNHPKEK